MIDALRESAQSLLNFRIWLTILAASTFGASLGLINYLAAKKGLPEIQKKFPQLDQKKLNRVDWLYQRWGARVLLLSSVPVLGTVLTLGAGMYGVQLVAFMIWSVIALLIRNWLLFLFFTVLIGGLMGG